MLEKHVISWSMKVWLRMTERDSSAVGQESRSQNDKEILKQKGGINMRNKKGFTLAELSIVLALVAVISAVVVSFTVMMSERTKANQYKLNLIQELDFVETTIEGFVDSVGGANAVFDDSSSGVLSADVGGNTHSIGFSVDSSVLTVSRPDISEYSITLETINGLSFKVVSSGNESLIICTATYFDNNALISQSFTVFSRVGQTVGA